jgi:hypothetical protein
MKTLLSVCLFSFFAIFGYAQKHSCPNVKEVCAEQQPPQQSQERATARQQTPQEREAFRQKIQAHKIAYFTERLSLTPAEAEKFWSLYNTYQDEREKLLNEFVQKTRVKKGSGSEFDVSKLSDAEARKLVNDRALVIGLERKFHHDLCKLFSDPKRVLTFYDTERGFQRVLIDQHSTVGASVVVGGSRQSTVIIYGADTVSAPASPRNVRRAAPIETDSVSVRPAFYYHEIEIHRID